jgi:hypothetical protein
MEKDIIITRFNEFIILMDYDTSVNFNYKTSEGFNINMKKNRYKICGANEDKEDCVTLKIETNLIESYDEYSGDIDNITIYYQNFFYKPKKDNIGQIIYDNIEKLKFDKYFCSYNSTLRSKLLDIEINMFPEFFKDRICSVCYELTEAKTNCEHLLCYLCWETILKKGNSKCPQCRECIRFINTECFMDDCKCKNT